MKLCSFTLTTGNRCNVTLLPPENGTRHVQVAWDRLPLTASEQIEYETRIRPLLVARLAEFNEVPLSKTALVVIL